jgi:hypothetical protein
LTPFEREEASRYAWAEPLFRDVLGLIRESPKLRDDGAFRDLSGIFDGQDSLVFIDYCHTTESANARIAEAIAHDVKGWLNGSTP